MLHTGDDSYQTVVQNVTSRIFLEYEDEVYFSLHEVSQDKVKHIDIPEAELDQRTESQCNAGLDDWIYDGPFERVGVEIDNIDRYLNNGYIEEANIILDRIPVDVSSRLPVIEGKGSNAHPTKISLSPMQCVYTFLTTSLLEKLRKDANHALHARKRLSTSVSKLVGIITLHVPCASYNESASKICSDSETFHFLQLPITSDRHIEVW